MVRVAGECQALRFDDEATLSFAFSTGRLIPSISGGGIVRSRQPGVKPPIEYVDGLKAPVLAFFGGKDAFIPITEVDEFRDALKKAGKPAEVVFYPDADHGFMCDDRPSFHPVHAKEAWARTIAFFKEYLG